MQNERFHRLRGEPISMAIIQTQFAGRVLAGLHLRLEKQRGRQMQEALDPGFDQRRKLQPGLKYGEVLPFFDGHLNIKK
jgi:hypothetical protein